MYRSAACFAAARFRGSLPLPLDPSLPCRRRSLRLAFSGRGCFVARSAVHSAAARFAARSVTARFRR